MNIDEALRALCEKHGLSAISLHGGPGNPPYAFVHWGTGPEQECTHVYGDTMEDAVCSAIEKANAMRVIAPEIPTLEIGEIAA